MKKVPLAPDVDPRVIARGTPGFSGADLANLVNEAALLAARKGKRLVAMSEFEEAKDKVMMGTERKSMVMTEDEKKMTAYHEAGHAHRRAPRAGVGPDPQGDDHPARPRAGHGHAPARARQLFSYHRDKMYANLAVSMGGRVAEELIFGYDKVSSGASSRHQLCDRPRPRHGHPLGHVGRARPAAICGGRRGGVPRLFGQPRRRTCRTRPRRRSTSEIRRIVEAGLRPRQASADASIVDELETLAKALLEYETLTGDEIKTVIAGEA